MTKIFKQLARHWAVCLVVFSLLFVQAYCDLSLPDYTSRIVDTGIQQGGIESPLPETIRQSTLDALTLLMSEEDADALQNAYGYYLQDDGVLKLRTDLTDDERTALEDAWGNPSALYRPGGCRHHAGHRAVYGRRAGSERPRRAGHHGHDRSC